MEKLKCII